MTIYCSAAASDGRSAFRRVALQQRRFNEVDAAFAHEEGEGDRNLAYWQLAHRNYFGRRGQFEEDMLLYCDRFQLVEFVTQ